jgi:hypothetical protein
VGVRGQAGGAHLLAARGVAGGARPRRRRNAVLVGVVRVRREHRYARGPRGRGRSVRAAGGRVRWGGVGVGERGVAPGLGGGGGEVL